MTTQKEIRIAKAFGIKPPPDYRMAGHFFSPQNACTLCGKTAIGNFGRSSHLQMHVRYGQLIHKPARARRGCAARYAIVP